MRRFLALLSFSLLLVGPAQADPPAEYAFQNYADALQRASASDKPIFLYLGRHGCGYCDKTNKQSFSNGDVRTQMNKTFELAYVDSEGSERLILPNGERVTEAMFAERLNVVGTPVFFALAADGTEIARLYGFQPATALLAFTDYISTRHYETQSFRDYVAGTQSASQ